MKDQSYPVYGMRTTGNYVKLQESRLNFLYQSLLLNDLTKATKKENIVTSNIY